MNFSVRAHGQSFDVELTRHDSLFHESYREWEWKPDGAGGYQKVEVEEEGTAEGTVVVVEGTREGTARPRHSRELRNHCYYHGRVLNDDAAPGGKSVVAVSICDGVRGNILTSSHAITLEPAHMHLSVRGRGRGAGQGGLLVDFLIAHHAPSVLLLRT